METQTPAEAWDASVLVLPLQVSPLDVSPPLRLLSVALLLALYCFSVQSTDSCLFLLSFFALMLQWYRKHTLLSSASSPSLLPSLLLSDWLLHRDDISLFIVVSLSPSLSLHIPPAPPFLFTSKPPPIPYFYTLCLLYLYSLYPLMLLMAESQKHKLIIKASYSSIRDVCLPVHWSIREGSLTVWVNILDFLKIIKKFFWIMIF